MCFSSEVSFTASALLTAGGIIAVKKVSSKEQLLFACIPFIFAVQQLAEGFLWLSYTHAQFEEYRRVSTVLFLVVAQVIWPSWVPLSVLALEKNSSRRMLLKLFTFTGLTFSVYVAYCLFIYPFTAYPESHHLKYELGFPLAHSFLAAVLYFIPTVFSCVISSVKRMTTLGVVIFSSYVLARIFFMGYSISVWCFFSAIISLMVIYIVHLMRPVQGDHSLKISHTMEG
jgi:hypothetical protein